MRRCLWLILLLFTTTSQADWQDWKDRDRALFVASQLAITADWATTRYASRHWDQFRSTSQESNIFLGPYPSTAKVDLYFIGLLVSNYYITDWMPNNNYRTFYLGVRTYVHGQAAHNNQVMFGWRAQF